MDGQTTLSRPGEAAVATAPNVAGEGLQAISLAKSFKGRQVVRDVSLQIRRGEIAACWAPTAPARRPASTS